MQYISTPKPQAQQAIYFGETPVNKKACKIMDKLSKGSCAQYSANRRRATTARSSSGRRRSPTAATARRTAWTSGRGQTPGRRSRARCRPGLLDGGRLDARGGARGGGALSRAVSRFAWRRPGLKTLGQSRPPVAAFLLVYVAALVALLIQCFWTSTHSPGRSSTRGLSTTSGVCRRPVPARSSGARSRSQRRSPSPACCSRSRTPTSSCGSRRGGCGSRCSSRPCCRCGSATSSASTPGG